jgi:flagellar basal-body rod modification protein FlgD
MATSAISPSTGAPAVDFTSLNSGNTPGLTANDAGSADRFLKLLVAQMRNQDPLNPMDNAQVTSQMAQINTVDGINRLNDTVQGFNTQFVQLQALQGAALLGRQVSVPGDRLAVSGEAEAALGAGAYQLSGPADRVRVEILNGAGRVVASQELGSQTAGEHSFEWAGGALAEDGQRFRVVATRGAALLPVQPLMFDRVLGVSTGSDGLQLDLKSSGQTSYAQVRAVREGG